MKHLTVLSLFISLVAVAGCNNNRNDDFDQAPPPADDVAYDQEVSFEPVEVTLPEGAAMSVDFTDPPPPAMGSTHTIVKGDTLYSIAKRHYGSGNRWPDIVAANPGLEPTKLTIGRTITLP